jgi:hypothetical protein
MKNKMVKYSVLFTSASVFLYAGVSSTFTPDSFLSNSPHPLKNKTKEVVVSDIANQQGGSVSVSKSIGYGTNLSLMNDTITDYQRTKQVQQEKAKVQRQTWQDGIVNTQATPNENIKLLKEASQAESDSVTALNNKSRIEAKVKQGQYQKPYYMVTYEEYNGFGRKIGKTITKKVNAYSEKEARRKVEGYGYGFGGIQYKVLEVNQGDWMWK